MLQSDSRQGEPSQSPNSMTDCHLKDFHPKQNQFETHKRLIFELLQYKGDTIARPSNSFNLREKY